MTLARLDEVLADALADGRGVGAFNVVQLEHAEAWVAAAEQTNLPVVLQISENAVRYHGSLAPVALATRTLAERAGAVCVLHLAASFPVLRIIDIAQNGEHPGTHIGAFGEGAEIRPGLHQRLLDEVVSLVDLSAQRNGKRAQARDLSEKLVPNRWTGLRLGPLGLGFCGHCCPPLAPGLSHSFASSWESKSRKRSGTSWLRMSS